jgi:hypothetical protein
MPSDDVMVRSVDRHGEGDKDQHWKGTKVAVAPKWNMDRGGREGKANHPTALCARIHTVVESVQQVAHLKRGVWIQLRWGQKFGINHS